MSCSLRSSHAIFLTGFTVRFAHYVYTRCHQGAGHHCQLTDNYNCDETIVYIESDYQPLLKQIEKISESIKNTMETTNMFSLFVKQLSRLYCLLHCVFNCQTCGVASVLKARRFSTRRAGTWTSWMFC